ncbi:hypothetical protein GCM10007377_08750 [Galliscardovia ingluviei]|uniref:Sel1 repeat family protein n=1 Tax=Galliscardovia ingluviei TaxID=1769422 RepID=A0A8J3F224_9BIFI|nr:hypothetical protein [Galliscardovia ingluviei]GGI14001.1 hypothetical protein GCM10007377_08750 [Galliscardovia ingluviei]
MRRLPQITEQLLDYGFDALPKAEQITQDDIATAQSLYETGLLAQLHRQCERAAQYCFEAAQLGNADAMYLCSTYLEDHFGTTEGEEWLYYAARYGSIAGMIEWARWCDTDGADIECLHWLVEAKSAGAVGIDEWLCSHADYMASWLTLYQEPSQDYSNRPLSEQERSDITTLTTRAYQLLDAVDQSETHAKLEYEYNILSKFAYTGVDRDMDTFLSVLYAGNVALTERAWQFITSAEFIPVIQR